MSDSFDVNQRPWFDTLFQHLSDNSRAHLKARLEMPAPHTDEAWPDVPTRLLAFYFFRAHQRSQSDNEAQRSAAQNDLAYFRQELERKAVEKAPTVHTPTVHTSPPAPAVQNNANTEEAIVLAYNQLVNRTPSTEEIQIWMRNFANGLAFPDFLLSMRDSPEGERSSGRIAPDLTDADFIQSVYQIIEQRGCLPGEMDHFRPLLADGTLSRTDLVTNFFAAAVQRAAASEPEQLHDGLSCWIMGTDRTITLGDWQEKAKDTATLAATRAALRPQTPYTISADPGLRVSGICSLFRGGDFIEQFMENITSQTCFDKHCELVIVDADSPENESETIERYLKDHPNIRYKRMNSCVGIYEAWNIGVQMSEGKYLTNVNLDDLRREDSFEIQAGALDAHPFVDVVYQDFYYSFDPRMSWEDVAAFDYRSNVPVVTPYNMLRFNSPHNAPMWRRSLHDEMGLFDGSFKSAGDYEFWMRCMVAKKTFLKIKEPHVVYYQNPKGLSTRSDTRGLVEGRMVMKRYAHQLIAPAFTADLETFAGEAFLDLPETALAQEKDRGMLAQMALRDLVRASKPHLGLEP